MSTTSNSSRIDRYSVAEDFALEALVAMEAAWERAHRGRELASDVWGEGPSRLRFADLGLDARVRSHAMVGMCPRHGEFAVEWTGRLNEDPPSVARCTEVSDGQRCPLNGPLMPMGGLLSK